MIIRTEYLPDTGKIRVKGGGKQRTVPLTNPVSPSEHGKAAGILALLLGLSWHDGIEADHNEEQTKFGFEF